MNATRCLAALALLAAACGGAHPPPGATGGQPPAAGGDTADAGLGPVDECECIED